MVRVNVDHAELVGLLKRLADACHGELRTRFDVLLDHLAEVHAVDVVGADDDHDVGLDVLDDVDGLIDRVGRPEIPVLAQTLLCRHRGDIVAEQRRETPHLRDVTVKGMRLVLGQHNDMAVIRIHQVAQGEVDQSEYAAERYGRLCTVTCQRHEARAFAACQDDGENLLLVLRHLSAPLVVHSV